MTKSDKRQFVSTLVKTVLDGFAHSNDHRQLIWDLKALEPRRGKEQAPREGNRKDDGHRLRMEDPTILQEVCAEVID